MRPVNLLPPEERRGDHAPLRAGVASYAIVGVLAAALIGLVLVIMTENDINENKSELTRLEAREQAALAKSADLAPYENFATLEQTRSETVTSLATSRFDWERVLNELALVIPDRVTLEGLAGTASSSVSLEGASTTGTDGSIVGPSLQLTGCAPGQRGTARLLASLRDIDGVTRVGMQSSEIPDEAEGAAGGQPAIGDEGGSSATCTQEPGVAEFSITVAFDAVPAPDVAAAPPATGAPAATTPPATTAPDASGVDQAQADQQAAANSAAQQSGEAAAAANVGGS